jgi:hypothetical protein
VTITALRAISENLIAALVLIVNRDADADCGAGYRHAAALRRDDLLRQHRPSRGANVSSSFAPMPVMVVHWLTRGHETPFVRNAKHGCDGTYLRRRRSYRECGCRRYSASPGLPASASRRTTPRHSA